MTIVTIVTGVMLPIELVAMVLRQLLIRPMDLDEAYMQRIEIVTRFPCARRSRRACQSGPFCEAIMDRFSRRFFLAGGLGTVLLCGCHQTAEMFYQPPAPAQMLGQSVDQFNELQENNAEALKFTIYVHEFEENASQDGKSVGGLRLTEAGEDHVRQIAASMRGGVHYPVLIERGKTSTRGNTEWNYPVHQNAELDNRRREIVVRALAHMGIKNADRRVSVAPSPAEPLSGMEAEQAYRQSLRNNAGGGGGGFGFGGFGGGGFQ